MKTKTRSPTYAGPTVRLLFAMITELPCENMRFEAGDDCGSGDGAVGVGGSGACGGGSGTSGSGGRSRVPGRGEAPPAIQDATVRNADAVMVRVFS